MTEFTYSAESANAFIKHVGLDPVDAFDDDIETQIKLFVVNQ